MFKRYIIRYIQFYRRFDAPLPSYFCHGTVSPKRTRVRIDGAYLPLYCNLISDISAMSHRIHWNVFTYMSGGCFLVFIKLDLPKYPMDCWWDIPKAPILWLWFFPMKSWCFWRRLAPARRTMQLHGVILASHIASINCSSGAWIGNWSLDLFLIKAVLELLNGASIRSTPNKIGKNMYIYITKGNHETILRSLDA